MAPHTDAPILAMIVAQAKNRGIGKDNQLLWHLSEDLKFFKATTMGKPIIMGRKTFESIGRPLPGRLNIVLTRDIHWHQEGVAVVHDIDSALELAMAEARDKGAEEVMVIGGANIYEALLPEAQRLYLTQVDLEPEADAFFPQLSDSEWNLTSSTPVQTQKGVALTFETYQRI